MSDNLQFYIENQKIYLEIVLIEFQIPLLFICRDDNDERYSVLCIDSDLKNLKYILIKSDIVDIIEVLNKNITLEEFFRKGKDNTYWEVIASDNPYNDKVKKKDLTTISSEKLPDTGIYFDVESDEISRYTSNLEQIYKIRLYQKDLSYRSRQIIPIIRKIYGKSTGISRIKKFYEYSNFVAIENQSIEAKILNLSKNHIAMQTKKFIVQAESREHLKDKSNKDKVPIVLKK